MNSNEQEDRNQVLTKALRQLKSLQGKDRSWLSFTVYSNTLTAEEIGSVLNLESTDSAEQGDLLYEGKKVSYHAKLASWTKSSEGSVRPDTPVKEQLHWLLTKHLYDKRQAIQSLINQGCSVYLTFQIQPWARNLFFEIDPSQMQQLARLGVVLRVNYLFQNTDSDY
ncbi:MAG: DUF4279 domain-containing protein [Candidatus Melainabacteria bacterium]|nr:DUF4279 domain-containing protein [Candidatus Melainabacteria bacterium]